MRIIALCLATIISLPSMASPKNAPILDYNKFMNTSSADAPEGQPLDIFYNYVVPQFEENPDPSRQVVMEYFQTEYDGSEASKRKLKWFKELMDGDKKSAQDFAFEAQILGPKDYDLHGDENLEAIIDELGPEKVQYENMPEAIDFGGAIELSQGREPSSLGSKILSHRYTANIITLVKLTAATGGTYYGLVATGGVSPAVASSVSFIPGLASAGLTYAQGWYGNWLTSGKWSKWLMNSDSFMARNLRKGLFLNPKDLQKTYADKRQRFLKKYPEMAQRMPETINKEAMAEARGAVSASRNRLSGARKYIHMGEEYFRWYLMEAAFIGASIKLPQAVAGISVTSLGAGISDVIVGSAKGFAAQMFGDLAAQKKKYQQFEALRESVVSGKHPNTTKEILIDDKKVKVSLLDELEMILDRDGAHKAYNGSKFSHGAIVAIENAARIRASAFSIMCVVGVGLDIATKGGMAAQAILIGTGTSGFVYYAHVEGWTKRLVPLKMKEYFTKFQAGIKNLNMRSLFARFCQQKFLPN